MRQLGAGIGQPDQAPIYASMKKARVTLRLPTNATAQCDFFSLCERGNRWDWWLPVQRLNGFVNHTDLQWTTLLYPFTAPNREMSTAMQPTMVR
jgi:hypothetical protein